MSRIYDVAQSAVLRCREAKMASTGIISQLLHALAGPSELYFPSSASLLQDYVASKDDDFVETFWLASSFLSLVFVFNSVRDLLSSLHPYPSDSCCYDWNYSWLGSVTESDAI